MERDTARVGRGQCWAWPEAQQTHFQLLLTCAFALLEHIAWLAGECLIAAEGAHCVQAVLTPAACVHVRHTLVDVCGESEVAVRACRMLWV